MFKNTLRASHQFGPFIWHRRMSSGTAVRALAFSVILLACVCARADDCPKVDRGWFVRICRTQTKAPGIRLEIGLGGLRSSHRPWLDWRENVTPDEFDLPIDLVHAKEIWIKVITLENPENDDDEEVNMCVFFNDHVTQAIQMDDEPEEHETSRGDNDAGNCDCR